ncbi:MAG: MBL fold metallo-hydrolase [Fuerstiella sp.]|nr:MBL fold metallo-hydrolase [Fuerstiella sp.]
MGTSSRNTESGNHAAELVLTGTGTSIGVPVVGCDCAVCTSDDASNRRMRSGVLVRAPNGEFVIDTGPELRLQLIQNRASLVQAALFTHAHADHVMGLDDLRIFSHRMDSDLPLFCEDSVEQAIRQMFSYAFADREELAHRFAAPRFQFQRIVPGNPFDVLGLQVTPIRLHHGRLPILGFRIGDVAFCTDVSSVPSESNEYLQGLDTLILGALRYRPHPTHLHVDAAVQLAKKFKPRQTFLTHMAHDLDHATLHNELPDGIEPAHDGLAISVRGG